MSMRIVFFAIPGPLAWTVWHRLTKLPVEIVGLVHPAPPGMPALTILPPTSPIPRQEIVTPITLCSRAAQANVPRFAVSRDGMTALAAQLEQQRVDLAVVVCWPWRIRPPLLTIPRLGFLNMHPSPLPELRGPEPLFWALRLGWQRTAITWHLMDAAFDHGPIVRQAWFDLPFGERLSVIETVAGQRAAHLLPAVLTDLATSTWQPQPQATGGSTYPAPQATDLHFTAAWSVVQAYAFVRAIAEWGQPFTYVAANGQTATIGDAIDYRVGEQLAVPVMVHGNQIMLQLRDGILVCLPISQAEAPSVVAML
ncbi:MAG: formyltransferase family protein [Chloroflexus sp.]|uniref:formyltransferase family protein n=1 Tax=Chloroflexus sp. TaxID=1904827 RepID=UPI003D0E5219